jgi:hypothetical protein
VSGRVTAWKTVASPSGAGTLVGFSKVGHKFSTDEVFSSVLGTRERTMKRSRIRQEHIAFAVRKVESETPAGGVCWNSERDRFAHALPRVGDRGPTCNYMRLCVYYLR